MPQSLSKVLVHIVYSTKGRRPWLKDEGIRKELFAYKATVLRDNVDTPALIINGVEDHVHMLCLLSRKFAIKSVIEEAKTETSKWLKKQSAELSNFAWQGGYGIFSVSESNCEQVRRYIQEQERHHMVMSFKDEFRLLCKRHGIEIDERYVWD